MTTRDEAGALVRRMQECFNDRTFDEAAPLHTPGFVCHPLGTVGPGTGAVAWRVLVARHPGMHVVLQDILVDGDRAATRSAVVGVVPPDAEAPMLFEIFRIEDGRFAEMWGASSGFPSAAAPEDVLG